MPIDRGDPLARSNAAEDQLGRLETVAHQQRVVLPGAETDVVAQEVRETNHPIGELAERTRTTAFVDRDVVAPFPGQLEQHRVHSVSTTFPRRGARV